MISKEGFPSKYSLSDQKVPPIIVMQIFGMPNGSHGHIPLALSVPVKCEQIEFNLSILTIGLT